MITRNLRGDHKKAPVPPKSENSMPSRLKLNFGLSGMFMPIFMLLSQSARISCLSAALCGLESHWKHLKSFILHYAE